MSAALAGAHADAGVFTPRHLGDRVGTRDTRQLAGWLRLRSMIDAVPLCVVLPVAGLKAEHELVALDTLPFDLADARRCALLLARLPGRKRVRTVAFPLVDVLVEQNELIGWRCLVGGLERPPPNGIRFDDGIAIRLVRVGDLLEV